MNNLYHSLSELTTKNIIKADQIIEIDVDIALAHDKSMHKIIDLAIKNDLEKKIKEWNKLYVTIDHFLPAPTIEKRKEFLKIQKFCKENNINLFDHGEGIMHQVLAENFNYDLKDKVVVGVDGHVATAGGIGAIPFSITADEMVDVLLTGKYKFKVPEVVTIEILDRHNENINLSGKDLALFIIGELKGKVIRGRAIILGGDYLNNLTKSKKMSICNMLGELGAKTCYFNNNKISEKQSHIEFKFNLSEIDEMIALPGSPENVKKIREIKNNDITQVFIGGCTNGRIDDMEEVVKALENNIINKNVTLIVCPASRKVANDMDKLRYSSIIRNSGGIIINPGCGACAGVHQGVLSGEDILLTTTVRNTPGRMGSENAKIYLVSPKIAAISAIKGKISN